MIILAAAAAWAQRNADNVRALNGRVLQFRSAMQGADAGRGAQVRAEVSPVFAQRAAALKDLIRESPRAALGLAFSQDLINDLAVRFPASARHLERHGTWQGKSEHVIFDDPVRQVHESRVQIRSGNETLQVYSAAGEPHCVSGNTVSVAGMRVDDLVAASEVTVQTAAAEPLACSTVGPQNIAVLLVQFPGKPLPTGVTSAGLNDIFFSSTGKSVNNFWQEASYGRTSATGNVFGPFMLDRIYSCNEIYAMIGAAITAADPFVNFPSYTRIFVVFPNPGTCSFAGMGMMACSTFTSADGDFQASGAWLLADYMASRDSGVQLATHEGGHNLSLNHAASRDFGTEALGPLGAAGTLNEYGDGFSTMGSWNFGHYSAQHKVQLGWLPAENVITTESNGSYDVQPLENAASGVQALKVRRGAGNDAWLWLEYRQPVIPYDSTLSGIFSGALVHYEDTITGAYTHLVDFTPATVSFGDPALTGTWVDPYTNLSLSVTRATSSALSLNVSYGAPPCARVQPGVTITPLNPSAAIGGTVSQTVSVVNNDTAGCTPSTFALTSTLPSGWTTTFSPTALTLSPGQTATATMTKNVPAGITAATYPVNATASDANHSATGTANVTAIATCSRVQPAVTLSPGSQSANAGQTVSLTISVTNQDSSACAASTLSFSSSLPSGWATSFSPTALTLGPGQTGTATMTKSIAANATPGNYPVTVTAADANHSAAGTANVTVNAPCSRLQPTVTLSPGSQTANAGASLSFNVSVTNRDGAACSASTFTLSSTLPSGWMTTLSPVTMTLSPGQSGTATMTKGVPAGAAPSTYPVNAIASEVNHSAVTATGSVTVTAPLQVTVSATPASVKPRDIVTIRASVTKNGPVSGAAVTFTLKTPKGNQTQTATTNSSGIATWSYRAQQKGSYTVSASANASGEAATSNAATFMVQ